MIDHVVVATNYVLLDHTILSEVVKLQAKIFLFGTISEQLESIIQYMLTNASFFSSNSADLMTIRFLGSSKPSF